MKTLTLEELEGWQIQESVYYRNLDAAVSDRLDGKSGVVNKYQEALTATIPGERPGAS